MIIPATSDAVRREVQRLLGFNGKDIDGDLGKNSANAFNQLGDMPDAAPWPVASVAPTVGVNTSPDNAMRPALGSSERERAFGGPFRWRSAPEPGNREAIEILGGWEADNIVSVALPELEEATGGKFKRMRWNKRAATQLMELWKAWKKAGLLHHIKSYEGAFVPRTIRGSSTSLSNHAYGTAFDINYEGNELGAVPAAAGTKNSVRELVPLAHAHGFFWGGNFSRLDGMHMEVCKILA